MWTWRACRAAARATAPAAVPRPPRPRRRTQTRPLPRALNWPCLTVGRTGSFVLAPVPRVQPAPLRFHPRAPCRPLRFRFRFHFLLRSHFRVLRSPRDAPAPAPPPCLVQRRSTTLNARRRSTALNARRRSTLKDAQRPSPPPPPSPPSPPPPPPPPPSPSSFSSLSLFLPPAPRPARADANVTRLAGHRIAALLFCALVKIREDVDVQEHTHAHSGQRAEPQRETERERRGECQERERKERKGGSPDARGDHISAPWTFPGWTERSREEEEEEEAVEGSGETTRGRLARYARAREREAGWSLGNAGILCGMEVDLA